jgi:hypothetical protein
MTPRRSCHRRDHDHTPADQGECPDSSTDTRPIELSGHNRRSEPVFKFGASELEPSRGQAGCGLVALLRNRGDHGQGALARLFCKRKRCPDCGPRKATRDRNRYQQLLEAYLEANPDARLATFTLAKTAWATCSARLRRHHLPVLQLPDTPGYLQVVTLDQPDQVGRDDLERVEDLGELLDKAFAWTPERGFDTRRARAVGWDTVKQVANSGQAGGEKPQVNADPVPNSGQQEGWDLLALVWHSYADAIAIATRRLGMDPQPLPERELRDDWAEAHTVRLPAEGSLAWKVMWRELNCIDPYQWKQNQELRKSRAKLREEGQLRRAKQDPLPGLAA